MITFEKPLSVTPGGALTLISLNQYDSDFQLKFTLYSNEGTFTLEPQTTANIRGTKKDGNGYSASASITDDVVTVTGDVQMTAVPGDNIFEVVLEKNDLRIGTANFVLRVEPAALDKETISNSQIRELVDVIDRTDELIAAKNSMLSAVEQFEEDMATVENYENLTNKPTINDIEISGAKTGAEYGLVDAVPGKGLSSNDYTNDEKTKLEAIPEAESGKGYSTNDFTDTLKNKLEAIPAAETGKGYSANDYTTTEKEKLAAIPEPVRGKGYSTNDYTNEDKTALGNKTNKQALTSLLDILLSKKAITTAQYNSIISEM